MNTRARIPRWFVLAILNALGANVLAGMTTSMTVDLMHGVTPFALSVRAFEVTLLPYYQGVTYLVLTTVIVAYLWPILDFTRRAVPGPPSAQLQRRVINAPFVIAAIAFSGWLKLLAGELRLGGEVRQASVLFCDLRGFTGFAETAPPAAVVATLSAFFTAMTAWVRDCGGFVDKFIGDAVLVVFGLFDPDALDAGAAAALRCGLGMPERLARTRTLDSKLGQYPQRSGRS